MLFMHEQRPHKTESLPFDISSPFKICVLENTRTEL